MVTDESAKQPALLEDNLKKALTELLILHLFSQKEYYIGELSAMLQVKSGGVLTLVFPYAAIYRLHQAGHITESQKRNAPDHRRRQYYKITEKGRQYLSQLLDIYQRFTNGVSAILQEGEQNHEP